jgi:cation diffusion facilitator family transporter
MHSHSLDRWTHEHVFLGAQHARNERRTWLVVGLTVAMMVVEIAGGSIFGSMALLADGWHMSTHALAIGIAASAYLFARRHAHDQRFAFGTGKLGELAAFASAIVLAMIALLIAYESFVRLAHPVPILYGEAIAIAAVGLMVNLGSAWLLREDHAHHHHHHHHEDHDHAHHHHGADNNLRAAYLHVLADAATSVLAIASLALAWSFNWLWIDPVVGVVGACVIASWSYGLIRDAGAVLLDVVPDQGTAGDIRRRLEIDGDRVSDLHMWQVGPGHRAAVVSIVTDRPQPPSAYKSRLSGVRGLSHVSVEVQPCEHHAA